MNDRDDLKMILTYAGAVDAPDGDAIDEVAPDIYQLRFWTRSSAPPSSAPPS